MLTVVRKPNAKLLLRSSFVHFVHHANRACAETRTRSRSTYLLAKTPPLVMCACFTHLFRATHLPTPPCFFFVLPLHTPLINPAVLLHLHYTNRAPFSYRNNKLIFMNKNMLRFVKWVLRAYHRYRNGVNTGIFTSKYNFDTNNSTCETAAVHITTSIFQT